MQTGPKPMKVKPDGSASRRAFTRLELVMVGAMLVLLTGIALPVLANSKLRGEQAMCFNNLRRIGHAFQLWANDHEDRNPWVTPVSEGGTFSSANPLKANAYFQMGMVSNELATPQVLICPSDRGVGALRRMAGDFSYTNAEGGFFVPGFRNAALSYIIGLHSFPDASRAILSGDRNIRWDGLNQSCSAGINSCALIWGGSNPSAAAWTNAIHGESGNLLFNDGRVAEVSNAGLRQASKPAQDDISNDHFLVPN